MKSSIIFTYKEVENTKVYPNGMEGCDVVCYVIHGKGNDRFRAYSTLECKGAPLLDDNESFLLNKGFLYEVRDNSDEVWK